MVLQDTRTRQDSGVDHRQPSPAEALPEEPGDDRKSKTDDDTERDNKVRPVDTDYCQKSAAIPQ